jgi:hypothetical protein
MTFVVESFEAGILCLKEKVRKHNRRLGERESNGGSRTPSILGA